MCVRAYWCSSKFHQNALLNDRTRKRKGERKREREREKQKERNRYGLNGRQTDRHRVYIQIQFNTVNIQDTTLGSE